MSVALELFGQTYLSPSRLNLWGNNQLLWFVRYGLNVKGKTSPNMALGTAVEAGLQTYFTTRETDEPHNHAMFIYNSEMFSRLEDEDVEACRKKVFPMLDQAIEGMKFIGAGTPKTFQRKVECEIEGISIPMMGFTDFEWEDTLIDLKTTSAMPSKPKPEHLRQIAFYWKATGKQPALLYVTPKKNNVYTPSNDELKWAWEELVYLARSLERALEGATSISQLMAKYPANFGDYFWDDESRDAAKAELKKEGLL